MQKILLVHFICLRYSTGKRKRVVIEHSIRRKTFNIWGIRNRLKSYDDVITTRTRFRKHKFKYKIPLL